MLGVWYNAPDLSSNRIALGAYNSKALINKIHQPLTSTLTPLHTHAGTHAIGTKEAFTLLLAN